MPSFDAQRKVFNVLSESEALVLDEIASAARVSPSTARVALADLISRGLAFVCRISEERNNEGSTYLRSHRPDDRDASPVSSAPVSEDSLCKCECGSTVFVREDAAWIRTNCTLSWDEETEAFVPDFISGSTIFEDVNYIDPTDRCAKCNAPAPTERKVQ